MVCLDNWNIGMVGDSMRKNTTKRNILPAIFFIVAASMYFLFLIFISMYHAGFVIGGNVVEETIRIDEIYKVSAYRFKDPIKICSNSKVYYVKEGTENEYSLDELMQVLEVGDTITIKHEDGIGLTLSRFFEQYKNVLEIREGDQCYRSLEAYRHNQHLQAKSLPFSTALFILMWFAAIVIILWAYGFMDFPLIIGNKNKKKKAKKKKAEEEKTYKTGDKTGDEGAPS